MTELTILFLGFNYTFVSNLLFPALVGIQEMYNLSATQLSLYASIPALINIIFQPAAGRLSDRLNRSVIILIGLGAYAIGGSTIAAVLFFSSTFGFVLLGRSIMGFAELGAFPQYLALIREKLPVSERQAMMGRMELFTSLGGTIAPFLGGFLVIKSIGLPFVTCAIVSLGVGSLFFITTRLSKKTLPAPNIAVVDPIDNTNKPKWILHHSFFGGYLVLGILVVFQTFIGSYVNQVFGFSTKQIGFTLAVIPSTMALGSLLMIRLRKDNFLNSLLVWTGFTGLLGIIILAWSGQPIAAILGLGLIGFALGFWLPIMDHDISEAGISKTSGLRLSYFQQSKSLGILTLPPLVGLIIDFFGSYGITFSILGLFTLLLGFITIQMRKRNIPNTY